MSNSGELHLSVITVPPRVELAPGERYRAEPHDPTTPDIDQAALVDAAFNARRLRL